MMRARLICAIFALCGSAYAEYIIAYKDGGVPAWAPADVQAYDYRDWHSLNAELQGYNPPFYPTVILRNTRIMSVQPDSWTGAVADIAASKRSAMIAQFTTDQLADIAACQTELGMILYSFGIALPVRPKAAIDAMIEAATTLDQLKAANKALALYTRLRVEYGFTDAEIGGVE